MNRKWLDRITNLGNVVYQYGIRDSPAIFDLSQQPSRILSFREVDEMSDRAAHLLSGMGLTRGDRVAILAGNKTEYVTTYLGILRAGFACVPIDPTLDAQKLESIVRNSDTRIVITDSRHLKPRLKDVLLIRIDAFANQEVEPRYRFMAADMSANQPALYIYEFSSANEPRGIVLSHQSRIWSLKKRGRPGFKRRVLVASPLHKSHALSAIELAFSRHDSIVLLPFEKPSPGLEAIERYTCTDIIANDELVKLLVNEAPQTSSASFSSVLSVAVDNSLIPEELSKCWNEIHPRSQLEIVYCRPEVGEIFGPHPHGASRTAYSLGYPNSFVDLRMMNQDETPSVTEGFLQVRSPSLMTKYHKLPKLTAEVMTKDGYFRTPDWFRCDNNGFFFLLNEPFNSLG